MSNFQQNSEDNIVCGCGKHIGIGNWSPELRARVYERGRVTGSGWNERWARWLFSYKKAHGYVEPADYRNLIGLKPHKSLEIKTMVRDHLFGTFENSSNLWQLLQNKADKNQVGEVLEDGTVLMRGVR